MFKNKIFLLIFIIFFLLEISAPFSYLPGDDVVYFYMGKQVAAGLQPYQDFFYAHPPLQLYFYGAIFKFLPYNIHTFKAFFILLSLLNAWLLYTIARKELGERVGVLSVILFLFTPTMLFNASFEFGLTVGMTLFILGLKAEKRPWLQVSLFLLSSFYRFHFLFLIFGYYTFKILTDRKNYVGWINKGVSVLLGFLAINLLLINNIPNYATDVFVYHLKKPATNFQTFETIMTVGKMNYLLFLLPLSLALFYIKKADRKILPFLAMPLPFLAYLSTTQFFGYYFVLVVPFLSVISAYTFDLIFWGHKSGLFLCGVLLGFFIMTSAMNYASLDAIGPKIDIFGRQIVGDPSTVAFLALTQNNSVLNNDIDLNSMRFEAYLADIDKLMQDINRTHSVVIIKPGEGLYARNKEFRDFVGGCNPLNPMDDYLIAEC